jgi:phosphoribosylformylglycinamidine synthase subunit PurL
MTITSTLSTDITPEVKQLLGQFNLTAEEYHRIVAGMGRAPNFTELSMFSVLWSEHCCYKHSRHLLKTLPTEGPAILQGPGENAGVVDCGDGIHVAFKIESHNHPTAVEPYQGAGTGVGGILRDIFTMNARPIANLNALRFGPLSVPHNHYLFRRAVKGIGDYGNCVGVPTIGGEVFFDPCYSGNPLVNAMAIGVLQGPIVSSQAAGIGNPVVYVGSATGKDGMGGAAFASRELDDDSQSDRPAVQVGDPFAEKLLIEACLEAFQTGCVVAAQDMGAAGLTSSSCEMAAKGRVGMRMDLDKVPAREPDMTDWEFMLSESQERMLFVLDKGREQPVLDIFEKWGLNAVVIGEVIERPHVEIFHKGRLVVDIPAALLAEDVPSYDPGIVPTEPEMAKLRRLANPLGGQTTSPPSAVSLELTPERALQTLEQLLAQSNISKPQGVFQQYDRHVQNNTLQTSDELSAGVIRLRYPHTYLHSGKAMAATTDCNPRYVYLNPNSGTTSAVAEAYRNLIAVGASPLAVTNNLNFGNPKTAEVYYQLYEAVAGMRTACLTLNTPVTGGNVSLYNETHSNQSGTDTIEAIYPTPIIGMVGLIADEQQISTPCFKQTGDVVMVLGNLAPTLAGSEWQALQGLPCQGEPPACDVAVERQLGDFIMANRAQLASVQDVSMGGVLTTLAECWLQSSLGLGFTLQPEALLGQQPALDATTLWFGETNGTYVISASPAQAEAIVAQAKTAGLTCIPIGTVTDNNHFHWHTAQLSREQAMASWTKGISL